MPSPAETTKVRVLQARLEAPGITSYLLGALDGSDLPQWAPGAHIDVHLPSGRVRQYSLCGDPADPATYRIAVLELPHGRGGSTEVHRELRPGTVLAVGPPRQEFTLVDSPRQVFVAGGIGITPLLPMVHEADRRGRDWTLVHAVRSPELAVFGEELEQYGDRVRIVTGLLDVGVVAGATAGAVVHACGPAGMLDALADAMGAAGRADDLHLERFTATAAPVAAGTENFEVELARTGGVVTVGPGETVLEAIRAAGVDHPSSCEMGFCGTCETKVLRGDVDHRDDLLTPEEKAAGATMMICVSRAACPRIVLDI
jgi:ferredoxin-NADP reductase